MPKLRDLGLPPGARGVHEEAARLRARHRPDRLGQVDDARGDDRPDQRRRATSTSSRSRTRSSSCTSTRAASSTSASSGADAQSFALGAQGRAAPGPRRDPRRRDARPRDDLDRADRGRDRPPRVRDAAHPGHGADRRPHHRRVPARPAAAGARAAVGGAPGHRHPAAAADRRRQGPRAWPPRCSCRRRRSAT